MARRIWLDITGLRPGSDAGMYAIRLNAALGAAGQTVVICQRVPGLQILSIDEFREQLIVLPTELSGAAPLREMLDWSPALQPDDGLQMPQAEDVFIMLALSGDAARVAACGARMVLLATNVTVLARPDWRELRDVEAAQLWLERTAPVTKIRIAHAQAAADALQAAGVDGTMVIGSAADASTPLEGPAHPRPFIFASGEIGEAGQTRNLLLVWRRLLETMPIGMVPDLVIAGPIGAQAGDTLEQLANSHLLNGRARVILFPSPAQIAALARDCVFAVAMAAATGWGRGTHNAQLFGAPCLSAFASYGAVPFDPTNAAGIAARIRAWLVDPPVKPPMMMRGWDEVVRDLLRVIML